MPKELEGEPIGEGKRIGIVVSRFNEFVTKMLLKGTLDTLSYLGVLDDDITVAWVPGAVELPLVAKRLALSGHVDAVVVLGCVIRGETSHFDFVAGQVSDGVGRIMLDTGVPIIFGVLTTETSEQAVQRADVDAENRGADYARAAIEMIDLLEKLTP
ncbi:MAG: 6,7-dimethyl-8-ribityllumazine synthase [Candidatus Hydrogenedentes bacterium]|nr:6,7-dimethyl-8-ribityllumazine synthase [Candidatus Hydrogenedentota bacterium]